MAETGKRQLRISYGFEETEKIDAALGMMEEAIEWEAHTRRDASEKGD